MTSHLHILQNKLHVVSVCCTNSPWLQCVWLIILDRYNITLSVGLKDNVAFTQAAVYLHQAAFAKVFPAATINADLLSVAADVTTRQSFPAQH